MENFISPSQKILVTLNLQKLTRVIGFAQHQVAVPGPSGHVGDGVFITPKISVLG
jgi:hypothetical protein